MCFFLNVLLTFFRFIHINTGSSITFNSYVSFHLMSNDVLVTHSLSINVPKFSPFCS